MPSPVHDTVLPDRNFEAERRVGGEGPVGEVMEKRSVEEFPLAREHSVVEICADDLFDDVSLLNKTLIRCRTIPLSS